MKKVLFLLMMLCICTTLSAQQVSVKSVSLRQSDLRASTQQRMDAKGKPCAIVRVGIVGVKDLQFPEAVGNVDYSLGEYLVYVPEGTSMLSYRNSSGTVSGSVVFDDYGLEVETKRVYSVILESENHMRAAIFAVNPVIAKLTFDGKPIALDAEGIAVIEKPIGSYNYQVEAPGYVSRSGVVRLTDDDISTITNIALEQNTYAINIKCQPQDATLFIDNSPYGSLKDVTDLKLPDGEHDIRLTAVGYNDHEQMVKIDGRPVSINITMVKMDEKVVKHNWERTRTHVNIRPAYYLTIGGELFDKKQYLGHDWGIKGSFGAMQHFGGIFSVYEGIGGGVMNLTSQKGDWFEHPADSTNTWFLEVPLLIGVSVPFGKFNKHLFSILGGGYGKAMFTEVVDSKKDNSLDPHGNSNKTNWDYGLRAKAILDISRFTISAEASLSLAKYDKIAPNTATTTTTGSNKPNLFFGLSVGAKLGKL